MKIILLFLSSVAMAQTPIAEMPTAVAICDENQACVITAISDATAVLQFGSGANWCQTFTAPKLPLSVSYSAPNLALCKYDPFYGTVKTLAAQQKSAPYTVAYTLAGVKQPVKTIPALMAPIPPPTPVPSPAPVPAPVPAVTIVATYNCNINQMSDGTFSSVPGSCKAVTK